MYYKCILFVRQLDVRPVGDMQLTISAISLSNDRAVRAQPHGVRRARRDRNDVRPTGDIALTVFFVTHGDHSAVRVQSHGVPEARRDRHDILPAGDIALTVILCILVPFGLKSYQKQQIWQIFGTCSSPLIPLDPPFVPKMFPNSFQFLPFVPTD